MSSATLHHEVVLASAGTGKTYGLVVRYLALLSAGHPPGSILATTFTRKAAGEIQGRILARLGAAASDPDEARLLGEQIGRSGLGVVEFQMMLATVCRELSSLNVSTLDSFFNRMISVVRWELGLFRANSLAALEDPGVSAVRELGIDRMLESLAASDFEELVHLVARFYKGEAQRSVASGMDRVLVELYDLFRECSARDRWDVPRSDLLRLEDSELEVLVQKLRELAPGLPKALASSVAEAAELAGSEDWESLFGKGVGKKIREGERTFRGAALDGELLAALESLVQHGQRALLDRLREQGVATRRILGQFEESFRELLQQRGVVLFSDLAHALAIHLPTLDEERWLDVYYRLDSQVQHLLLDEFQDTSLIQWRALQPMVEEILAHGDGSHTFYCVGDPKQAIYGWRGGCPELFTDLNRQLSQQAGEELVLSESYRSSQVVLDTVNRVFEGLGENVALLGERSLVQRWKGAFALHRQASKPELPGYVALRSSPVWEGEFAAHDPWQELIGASGSDEEELRPSSHLEAAAQTVAGLSKELPAATIGVLVQTNRTVREMLDLLRDLGLGASGEGGAAIDDDPVVSVVLSALRLSDHPGDSASWHHLCDSYEGPLLLGALLERDRLDVAREVRRKLGSLGLPRLLSSWFRHTGGKLNERAVRRFRQLVRLAERYADENPEGRAEDFVEWVPRCGVAEPEPARIRVMTVHKSKGLEFDAVVLCELDRGIGRLSNPQVNVLRPNPVSSPEAIFRATNVKIRSGSEDLQAANQQEIERRLWDDLSGLYVGMTRARYALVLLVQPLKLTKTGSTKEKQTASGVVREALASEATPAERAQGLGSLFEVGDLSSVAGMLAQREPPRQPLVANEAARTERVGHRVAAQQRGRRLRLIRPSTLNQQARRVRAADLLRPTRRQERIRGLFLHALLARIDWWRSGGAHWDESELEVLARGHRLPVSTARRYAAELVTVLEEPAVADLLEKPGGKLRLWRERPFAVPLDRHLIRGVFDRVVIRDLRGSAQVATLLEFKSGETPLDESLPQLESYRDALAAMLGVLPLSIDSMLLSVETGRVLRL